MLREQVLPSIFESSADGLLLMREDGVAIDCNPATVALLGCRDKSQIIGRHARDFWPEYQPDGRRSEEAAQQIFNRLRSEDSLCFEWAQRCIDGSLLHIEVLLTAVEYAGERIIHVGWRDISRRRAAEAALAYRRDLEQLIITASSDFMYLPTEAIAAGVQKTLGALGRFVQADRSYIFAYDHSAMHNIYEWCAEGIVSQIERMQNVPIDAMAWSNERIARGEILNIPCVNDLPPEAHAEKTEFAVQGIRSVLVVPMERRGRIVGFVGFDAVQQERQWPAEVIDLLRIAAGLIANVLDRRDAELQLREANASLERRVAERTHQLEQRRRIAESLRSTLATVNSNQTLADTLDHLVRQATALLGADAGTLYSLDAHTQTGRIEASVHVFEDVVRRLEFDLASTSGSEMRYIIQQRRPVTALFDRANLEAIRTDPNVPDRVRDLRLLVFERFNGSVAVPIFIRDQPFGALVLYYHAMPALNDQELDAVMTMAEQAALAIENARLHQVTQAQHAEADQRRRIAEGLREGLAVLNSQQPLNDILAFIVRQATELLGTDGGALYLLDDAQKMLHVGAAYGLSHTYTAMEMPLGGAVTGRAVALGEPVSIPDMRSATGLLEAYLRDPAMPPGWDVAVEQLKANYNAILAIPIRTGTETYGAVTLYYRESQQFSDDVIGLALAFARQAALVVENARLREQVREAAVLAERNRLARDLHDAVTQALFSASIIADTLPQLWEIDPSDARQQLERLSQLTRGALAEMRSLLIELRPTRLVETDMQTLLRQLIDAAHGRRTIDMRLSMQGHCDLPAEAKVVFYRVAQEALNNIIKHSGAAHAFVHMRGDGHQYTLQVLDDGVGFDPERIGGDHFGVQIMQERAASIDAVLILDTAPGEGTEIKLHWGNHG
jgi:PAS domain S-box-containing protein